MQIVKYTADENGYRAKVTYEGEAVHDTPESNKINQSPQVPLAKPVPHQIIRPQAVPKPKPELQQLHKQFQGVQKIENNFDQGPVLAALTSAGKAIVPIHSSNALGATSTPNGNLQSPNLFIQPNALHLPNTQTLLNGNNPPVRLNSPIIPHPHPVIRTPQVQHSLLGFPQSPPLGALLLQSSPLHSLHPQPHIRSFSSPFQQFSALRSPFQDPIFRGHTQ